MTLIPYLNLLPLSNSSNNPLQTLLQQSQNIIPQEEFCLKICPAPSIKFPATITPQGHVFPEDEECFSL